MLPPVPSALAERLGLGWDLLLGLVVPTLVIALIGVALTVRLWRRTRRQPPSSSGTDLFLGKVISVESAEGLYGRGFVQGSWWSLRSTGEPLRAGNRVRVQAVEGLVLVVEPLTADPPNEEDR